MKLGITLLPSPAGKGDHASGVMRSLLRKGKRRMHFVNINFSSSGILHKFLMKQPFTYYSDLLSISFNFPNKVL